MADNVFQDVDSAVKKLIPQLEAVKNAINGVTSSLIDLDKTTKKAATSQGDLKQKSEQLTVVDKELIKLDKQLEKAEAQLTEEYKQVQKAVLKKKDAVKKSNEELKKQAGIVKKTGGLFKSMTKSILAAGAGFLTVNAALGIMKKVFGDAFKTIKNFGKGMSEVRAIAIDSKLPLEEQNKQFQALKESAKELGSVTPKTASEVAGLQKEFAKLGFSTAEILAATEATISLSIAAGADLAESATVAASTVRGFGLSANETQRVVDVMAKSFSSSALDIQKFSTGMGVAAPVAKSFGKDIEFTTARLGVLADAGVDASTAGTSLRNIFLELSKRGLTWEEGLEKINNSTNKNTTALELFGKRGATAALILADNTKEANELEESLRGAEGAAQSMADTMANNLAGDIDKAKSAWEGMILSMEDGEGTFNKIFRGAVQAWTKNLSNLDMMFKGVSATVKDEMVQSFDNFAKKLMETSTAEETLLKLEATRIKFSEKLEGATKRETKALNINIAAIDETIEKIKLQQQAEEDAIQAAIDAEKERDRIKSELASEEAGKRAKEQAKIDEEVNQERLTSYQEFLKKRQASESEADKKLIAQKETLLKEDEAELKALLIERLKEEYDIKYAAAKKIADDEKQLQENKEDAIKEIKIGAAKAAADIISNQFTASIENNLAEFQAEQDAKQAILDDNLDKGLISEEEFEKKSKELEKKSRVESAKANKKKAILDATLAAAVSVVSQLAATPLPLGLPFIISAGLIGAAQIGVAAATPIPKFRSGIENFEGGLADVHSNEIIKLADGSMFETPKGETRMYLPPATDVLSEHKAEPILKAKDSAELKELQSINEKLSKRDKVVNHLYTKDYLIAVNENNTHRKRIIDRLTT